MRNSMMTLALVLFAGAASAEQVPTACEPTESAWWGKRVANGSIDMSRSIPALGIAYVTWSDGVSQIVTVAPVDGQGRCATERRMIR